VSEHVPSETLILLDTSDVEPTITGSLIRNVRDGCDSINSSAHRQPSAGG
jgi:hypothetical protein